MEKKTYADVVKMTGDKIVVRNNQAFILSDLYEKRFGVDVTIKIGEKLIHGYKLILSSSIPYFTGMFSTGFKEDKDSLVEMKGIDPDATEMIIGHAYTGYLEINRSNWKALLIAADYLQYQPIKDCCCDYLEKYLDFDSLFQIKDLSNLTFPPKLNKIVDEFIDVNFDEISLRSEFLKFTFDELLNIISRDELKTTSELAIFKALMKWIKYDLDGRKSKYGQLFKQIRLHLISKEDLITFVSNEKLITEDKECNDYLFKALSFHLLPEGRKFSIELWARTRDIQEESIYIVGGEEPIQSQSVIEILKLEPFCSVHQKLTDRWIFHGTALIDNKLYLLGGNDKDEYDITNRVIVFDLETQEYSSVEPMRTKRQRFGTVVIDKKIFVCGGVASTGNPPSNVSLASVELFDPSQNKWTFKAPMLIARGRHATVVLNGYIYAIGGFGLRSVERYDPGKNVWKLIAQMNCNRYWHSAAVYDGKIFVAGGHDGENTLNTVEVYDPENDTWTPISSMIHPRDNPLLLVYQSKLYAFGGRDDSEKSLTSIEELKPNRENRSFFCTQIAQQITIARRGGSAQVIRDSSARHH